ncbi:MFS transporter [Neptunomonas antarctica]|uniref:MFS transporter, MHS family, proline/betaine transporter n=1 Tax=Neptunomonas antarctica TaxID=619304 RepID=A0A1N7KFB9_9GAMM|nr:MFS transporter [Neptunomonas antarctica]SIS60164.1 MFS transporter, MHS family, proline/betaine transporter [Neptunomonas antarctica]
MVVGKQRTALLAGFIGNVVEWYDFALYGYMAGILAVLFFPEQSKTAGLIATYGIFAAGFLMRPLGSAVFGWLGDTIGRSRTMMISVIMMVVPTVFLGVLPTHETIGIWAPVLLVIIRLVQGLSVGGEFSSSVTYLVETAEDGRRGYAGSWANTGSMVGMLLGAGAAALLTGLLTADEVNSWGWRIPFLLGGLIGGVAIFLRRNLPQSQHFKRHDRKRPKTSPLIQAFTTNRLEMIQASLFASAYGVLFYIPLVYLPEWLHDQTGMERHQALQINTGGTLLLLLLIPVSGWLGDRFIRRTHFIAGAMLCSALLAIPLYTWLLEDGIWGAIIVQTIMVVILAVPLGSAPAMFVELFPPADRLSGYSVSYNLGLGVIGGATPMFATWLIDVSGFTVAPAGMLVVGSLLAFAVMLWMKDRSREPLR